MFFPPPSQTDRSTASLREPWSKRLVTWASRGHWRFAAVFTFVVFAAFSMLPVWTAWYFSPWEGNGELASFWTMLASVPRAASQVRVSELALEFYGPELVKLTVLLGVSIGAGRWLAGRSRAKAAPLDGPL